MNKEDILRQLKIYDAEQLPKLKRIIDILNQVMKSYEVVSTDFLSPDIQGYIKSICFHYPDLKYTLEGGYDDAEYKKMIVYPDYLESVESDLSIVDITYHEKYGDVSHRDVLGAVLGLGLKREVIGDILLENGHVQVMTSDHVATFLLSHLTKVGRVTVSTDLVDKDHLIEKVESIQWIHTTVKSLRLDAIIASGFNLSRSKAVDLIKAERVKLNHNVSIQTSKELSEGDLISVKGKGRIKIDSINGLTKKERYKVDIKKYI